MVNHYIVIMVAMVAIIGYCESRNSYVVLFPKMVSIGDYTIGITHLMPYLSGGPVRGAVRVLDNSDGKEVLLHNYEMPVARCSALPCPVSDVISITIGDQIIGSSYKVEVSGTGDSGTFNVSANVLMSRIPTLNVFIQTDKAVYKPSQKVKFRVITIDKHLKPKPTQITVTVHDPRGNRIKQMLNVESSDAVITGTLELSDEPLTGDWMIKVIGKDGEKNMETTKTFEVAEYVLPKFEVTVDPPTYLLQDTTEVIVTVRAMYTYGKPVNGSCDLLGHLINYSWEEDSKVTLINADLIDGKADFKVQLESSNVKLRSGRSYRFSATCTNKLTDAAITENKTVTVSYTKFSVSFHELTADNYKPNLLFRAYVKLLLPDMTPPKPSDMAYTTPDGQQKRRQMNLVVQTGRYTGYPYYKSSTTTHETLTADVDPSGIAFFEFPMNSSWASGELKLQAAFSYVENRSPVTKTKTISQFYSREKDSIQLSLAGTAGVLKVNQVASFKITTTYASSSFHFMFFSRNKIVLLDTITRTASTDHSYDITVDKDLAQRISPKGRLVVWTLTSTNELLADSIDFSVNGALKNLVGVNISPVDNQKVPAAGQPVTVEPAASVNVKVTAEANSYFGLSVVDKSAKLLGNNDLREDEILRVLDPGNSFSRCGDYYYPDYYPEPPMGLVFRRSKRRAMKHFFPPFTSCGGGNSLQVLENAGVYIRTDVYLHEEIMTTVPPYSPYPGGAWGPDGSGFGTATFATFPMTTMGQPMTTTFMSSFLARGTTPSVSKESDASMPEPPLMEVTKIRSLFPETWIWMDERIGNNGEFSKVLTVPDSITTWEASVFALHPQEGFGMTSEATELRVFRSFFVSMDLPYSIIRGEEFELKIIVQNYLKTTISARVTLEKSKDFQVSGPAGDNYQHAKMYTDITISPENSYTVSVWLKAIKLGNIPIEVKGQTATAADGLRRMLLIEPEGAPQEYTHNVFIDLRSTSDYSQDISITLPTDDLIPGSLKVDATAIGDIMGPAMSNIGGLLRMPYGCGEQNMLNFAPNIFIMNYLTATGLDNPEVVEKAKRFTAAGYQRELKYQRLSGCFSAFGERDREGDSTWLTSFVLKSFWQANGLVEILPEHITKGLDCLISKQEVSGHFREDGVVRHKAMQGGAASGVTLTAYVTITLLELKDTPLNTNLKDRYDASLNMARSYLISKLSDPQIQNDPYTLAIIGYALALDGNFNAYDVLNTLKNLANTDGGQMSWDEKMMTISTIAPPVGNIRRRWMSPYHKASSVKVETAAYALLMFVKLDKETESLGIMAWLVGQRNAQGGFKSTQDTVMALQALSELGGKIYSNLKPSLNAEITGPNMRRPFPRRIYAPDTQLLLQRIQLDLPEQNETVLTVTGRGQGIALVQIMVKYNIDTLGDDTGIKVNVISDQVKDGIVNVTVCASYHRDGPSGMVLYEIKPLSGFRFPSLDPLRKTVKGLKRTEQNDDRAVLYLDEVKKSELCVSVMQERYSLVANMERARAVAYAYYDTDDTDSGFYLPTALRSQTPQSTCPSCKNEDMCSPNPCMNGGRCSRAEDPDGWGYYCNCQRNTGGRNCQIVDPCKRKPCPAGIDAFCFPMRNNDKKGRVCFDWTFRLRDM